MNKRPYLVDVPVNVNIWIRPDCQRKQFEVLKEARPSILFLQSDGGRNEKEWDAIKKNRKIFDNEINWDCKIYKIYEDNNLGLYTMNAKVTAFIWEHVDRCIFLEDDHIPAISFFRYCAELLEKYKDDLRIDRICGVNVLEKYDECSADYFFSHQGSIWGTASWKRCYQMRDIDFEYGNDPYVINLLRQYGKKDPIFIKRAEAYAKNKYYEGHVAGPEFYHKFAMYGHNQLQIIPRVNLISNIGATNDSEHADDINQLPRGIRRVFNMETHEMNFPMFHPSYVIPDLSYENKNNQIAAYNKPIRSTLRTVERGWLKLKSGDIKYIIHKIKKKFHKKK